MNNPPTNPELIALYSDLIKIGIPALTGLLAGFLGGILPYFLERKRISEGEKKEAREFRPTLTIELIECLSVFSGKLFQYINVGSSRKHGDGEEVRTQLTKSTIQFIESETEIKKARAIAGLLGQNEIISKIDEFDLQATITLKALVDGTSDKQTKTLLSELKTLEKQMFDSLTHLIKKNNL